MPRFRRSREPEEHRLEDALADRRRELLGDPVLHAGERVAEILDELGLRVDAPGEDIWFAELAPDAWVTIGWLPADASVGMVLQHAEPPASSLDLLRRNAEADLAWHSVKPGDGGVVARAQLPMEEIERQPLVFGLEALARVAGPGGGPGEIEARLRAARAPADDEPEQVSAARARGEAEAALGELGLDPSLLAGRDNAWELPTDLGPLFMALRDNGEALTMSLELERSAQPGKEDLALWMLQCSDWAGARIGVDDLEDGRWRVHTACAVSALPLTGQAVAWGIQQSLRVARDFHAKN